MSLEKVDKSLILAILFMLGLGLVQVYSSSFIYATEHFDDGQFFFKRQLLFTLVGVTVMAVCLFTPWLFFERVGWLLWLICVALVGLTLQPTIGITAGGASRWLPLFGSLRLEPSEFLKYTTPFIIAFFIQRPFLQRWLGPYYNKDYNLVFLVAALALPSYMLHKQPDFGSFAIILMLTVITLFAFGLKWRYMLVSALGFVGIFYFYVVQVTYRYNRVMGFLDPWEHSEGKGFQVLQSMLSFYSGGLTGTGLGQGQGQLFFLPEAHTDFSFAVWGEETGFLGCVFLLCVYSFIVVRCLQVFLQTTRSTARIVLLGVTCCFAISVFINTGVALGILPPKGLTLPFLSYGGSSLCATCFGMGLVLCVDRFNRKHCSYRNTYEFV